MLYLLFDSHEIFFLFFWVNIIHKSLTHSHTAHTHHTPSNTCPTHSYTHHNPFTYLYTTPTPYNLLTYHSHTSHIINYHSHKFNDRSHVTHTHITYIDIIIYPSTICIYDVYISEPFQNQKILIFEWVIPEYLNTWFLILHFRYPGLIHSKKIIFYFWKKIWYPLVKYYQMHPSYTCISLTCLTLTHISVKNMIDFIVSDRDVKSDQ